LLEWYACWGNRWKTSGAVLLQAAVDDVRKAQAVAGKPDEVLQLLQQVSRSMQTQGSIPDVVVCQHVAN
jgi:hypothetical protein